MREDLKVSEKSLTAGVVGSSPLVSVIMTAYNGTVYLQETINSILTQSLENFEFIIIDDCSTDDTLKLIATYRDPRIILVRNPINQGISESRNAGLRMARGEFLAMTDQDDVSEPERLECQVRFLQANPEISAVASRVHLLRNGARSDDPMPVQSSPLLIHFAVFFGRHNTTYSSLCVRREFILKNNLFFNKKFLYAEDYELCSRIAECGKFSILPEPLVSYRLHESNNSKLHYAEMTGNGAAFMGECYARELGRAVGEKEARLIWRGIVEKKTPASIEELCSLGRLIDELRTNFAIRHTENQAELQAVNVLAAKIWHEIVDRSLGGLGQAADRVRDQFEGLQAWSPSTFTRLKSRIASVVSGLRARQKF